MALRGNLKDFSLPDVFQLVQLSRKTGVLRIAGPEAEGSIWFRDGDVFFAQSDWRRDQLGERLVRGQRITPAALARALEIREAEPDDGRRLGQILVDEGYITHQVLESFVQEQIQDTIFDLMRWDEGDFDFEVLPDVVHEDIGLSVSVENIVMEGSRRLEEWNRIKKKVPSTDMVFKMATAPGEGTFEISLKPIEWNLLLLIDGTRTVSELAHATRRTDFEVARVIYGLFSAGLLEVPSDDEVERLRSERARREDKRAALEAARAEREEADKAEALELEARLTAEAEARVPAPEPEAATTPVPAEEAAAEAVAPGEQELPEEIASTPSAPREPAEEPEFLSSSAAPPSSEDMVMFEQMMGAVLAPLAAEPATSPEAAALAAEREPELELEPESAAEPEAEPEPAEIAESVLGAPELEGEPVIPSVDDFMGVGAIPITDLDEIPAPPVAENAEIEPYAPPEGFVPSGDFETDLRTLGLGELPPELLRERAEEAPTTAEMVPELESTEGPAVLETEFEPEVGPAPEPELEPAPEPEPEFEPAPEPESEPGAAQPDLDDRPVTVVAEPVSLMDLHLPTEPAPPMSEIVADEPAVTYVPAEPEYEPADDGADLDDLEGLLRSLDVEMSAPSGVISSGTDYGAEDVTPGAVISTDAFLADFDSDMSLSAGLGDELTALTGGGTPRARPVATVSKIPEKGEGVVLHRDRMVDRSLIEQIIAGIENL
ncbi:MAG: DUF4388 domain-containing protein [Coriobacteriia bacterium]|nr:DUF4388 domain-containing protein [Coriobacteriia bacterium]